MKPLHATIRIEKQTARPALFYRGQNGLECYTFEEQHSSACREYYNDETRPAHTPEEQAKCADLERHYRTRLKLYDDVDLKVGTRLPWVA